MFGYVTRFKNLVLLGFLNYCEFLGLGMNGISQDMFLFVGIMTNLV